MAQQKGIVPLVGTIGGINFYYRKGKAVARKAGGGFSGTAIKNGANMVRIRENNSEFGKCSVVKKGFRIALFPFLKNYSETTLHGRMIQLFQQIKICDVVSVRGERSVGNGIVTDAGKRLFKDFVFTPKCSVGLVVPMKYSYDAVNCVYAVTDFSIANVRFPKGATHVEVRLGVLCVAFETSVFKMELSTALVLAKDSVATDFSLSPAVLPSVGMERFAFVGVQFFEKVNGVLYVLKNDGCVGLMVV